MWGSTANIELRLKINLINGNKGPNITIHILNSCDDIIELKAEVVRRVSIESLLGLSRLRTASVNSMKFVQRVPRKALSDAVHSDRGMVRV